MQIADKEIQEITTELRKSFPRQLNRKQALVVQDRIEKYIRLKESQNSNQSKGFKDLKTIINEIKEILNDGR